MLRSKDGQIFCSSNSRLFSLKVSQQNNNQSCNFGLSLFSLLKQCLGVVLVCTMLYIIILGLIIRSWDLRLDLKNWETENWLNTLWVNSFSVQPSKPLKSDTTQPFVTLLRVPKHVPKCTYSVSLYSEMLCVCFSAFRP